MVRRKYYSQEESNLIGVVSNCAFSVYCVGDVHNRCSILVTLVTFGVDRIETDLFIILLKRCQVLPGLGEFSLLHSFPDIPMHKGTLGIHKIKLVIQTSPSLGDGGGVAQHAYSTLHLGQVTTWHNGGWLIVDSNLKASGTPIHKLDTPLVLDRRNGRIYILWNNIASVQKAACHVLSCKN